MKYMIFCTHFTFDRDFNNLFWNFVCKEKSSSLYNYSTYSLRLLHNRIYIIFPQTPENRIKSMCPRKETISSTDARSRLIRLMLMKQIYILCFTSQSAIKKYTFFTIVEQILVFFSFLAMFLGQIHCAAFRTFKVNT